MSDFDPMEPLLEARDEAAEAVNSAEEGLAAAPDPA